MFKVGVKRKFSAAHSLREYDGNCERLHGHNWVVEAIIKGDDTDHLGMLVDFRVVKRGWMRFWIRLTTAILMNCLFSRMAIHLAKISLSTFTTNYLKNGKGCPPS